jgi:hypothetical protein
VSLAIPEFGSDPYGGAARRGKIIPRALAVIFLFASLLFLLGGVGSFTGAYLRSSDMPDGFGWQVPMEQLAPRSTDAGAVLIAMADLSAQDTLDQTLDTGDLESVAALVAYDARLSDPARVGALLQLGTRFLATKNWRRAAWSYQDAAFIATVSPVLSDYARTETLLTASTGLHSADAKEASRRILDQAYLITQYSPSLRRQQRVNRLNQIASAYDSLNLFGVGDQARDKAQQAGSAPDIQPPAARAPFIPIPGSLPPSPLLADLKHRRVEAVLQLLDDVTNSKPKGPTDWPQDSVNQVRYALLKEDDARSEFYTQQFPATKDPYTQIAIVMDKVNWLALKYRTARGGFGTNMVPEWTKNTKTIDDDLSDAWSDLYRVFQQQTNALSNSQDVSLASEDIARQQLMGTRWGWSQELEGDLRKALGDSTAKLREAQTPGLRLDTATRNNQTMYLLVPDDLYGQGARVLPQ